MLVSGPANGSLTLNSDGSFTYTPTAGFTGADGFTYQAVSGSLTSSVATVVVMVLPVGALVYDTFARPANNGDIFPWVEELGTWSITNDELVGTSPLGSYGYAYYDNNSTWSNFNVQAQIQFSSTSGLGGGIGGQLNPTSGAHYAAWIYPEDSPDAPGNGTAVLQLVKFETWTTYTLMGGRITLPGMGTNPHTLRLTFQTNSIAAYFDGVLETSVTDNGSIDGQAAYTNGTVSLDMYTYTTAYTMTVDNVIVSALATVANNDSYSTSKNTALHVAAPGVLANDSAGSGSLSALLVSNPSNGSLSFTNNGGFTYTPADNFTGVDSFTYEATDGQTTSGVATVTITINNSPVANNDSYAVAENTILTVGPPGILANDTGGSGSLSAILVTGPSSGTLALTNNGGFGYTPANNYTGSVSFTYKATDGISTSSVATVTITVAAPTTASNDIYGMISGTILNVPAPGVLANDVGGAGSLTALLASAPLHGVLNLTNSGGFAYQPTNNFTGIDDFTYQATDGVTTSAVAVVAVEVTPVGELLVDNFTRSLIWPWVQQSGTWGITNNALIGTSVANSYAYAYLSNNWSDYTVLGQIRFSTTNAWGGGIGGRVNPATGAQYAAWVYPEGSQGDAYPSPPTGLAVLKLLKFTAWGGDTGSTYTVMAQVNLPNVSNNWHTVQMTFQGTNIVVSYDGTPQISTNDPASYTSGGIDLGGYSDATLYTFSVSNVTVAPLVGGKQTPLVATATTASAITVGQTLASSTVTAGSFTNLAGAAVAIASSGFVTPTIAPLAGTTNVAVYYVPTDTADYNDVTNTVSVTVNKGTPLVATATTASAITVGQTLASSTVTAGSFTNLAGAAVAIASSGFVTPTIAPKAGTTNAAVYYVPTDTADYNDVTNTVSVTVNKGTPLVATATTASAITVGQTLSSSTVTAGSFTNLAGAAVVIASSGFVTPTIAPKAGTTNVAVYYVPTDTADYNDVTNTVGVTVNKGMPLVATATTASAITVGQTLASSTVTAGSFTNLAGAALAIASSGFVTPTIAPLAGTTNVSVYYVPTDTADYSDVTNTVSVTVNKGTPLVATATTASAITVGQTLASSTVTAGSFTNLAGAAVAIASSGFVIPTIAPKAGTTNVSVYYVPTDTADYNDVTNTVSVTVNKGTPLVATATTASAITVGQTLASSTVTAGSFTNLAGAAVAIASSGFVTPTIAPLAGTTNVSVYYVPTDTADYSDVTNTVGVTVNKGTPLVATATTASAITVGQTLASSTVTAGSFTNLAGAAVVIASSGFVTPTIAPLAGTTNVAVYFVPTDTADYNDVTNTVSVTVNKGTPLVATATTASAITVGQTLASSTVTAGSFTNLASAAVVIASSGFVTPTIAPNAGTTNVSVYYVPSDTADYNDVTNTVSVTVNKGTPLVATATTASAITVGQTLASSTVTAGSFTNLAGAAVVIASSGFVTPTIAPNAGTTNVSVYYVPSDTADYNDVTNTVTITVYSIPVANNDSYTLAENTILTVGPPGILANDSGGSGSLSAILVTGPANGTLALTNNGSFGYTPANNYIGSDSFTYQATDGISTSSVATVTITVTAVTTANNDIYGTIPGTILNVPAPGVLANDVGGAGSLTALLASAPLHGVLNLTNSGGFAYQPTNNFTGIDDFTYQATDGVTTSAVAIVAVEVTPVGELLVDNFTRSLIWPWVQQSGTWGITNNALIGTSVANSCAYAYLSNNWTDYTVLGQIRFSTTNAWGGGIGGRVDPTTGAQYAAWVDPEGSQGDAYPSPPTGLAVLKLLKLTAWGGDIGSNYTVMGQVNLPNVGNNWHTVQMVFQGTNIVVSYDGTQEISTNDPASYTSGGISAGMYSDSTLYTLSVSNVTVAPLVAPESYSVESTATLQVSAPGVLGNDTDVYGTGLTAALVSGPAHGILSLTNNGGFSYTPTNSFAGSDSFVYQANDGTVDLGTAIVSITVNPVTNALIVAANNQSRSYGTTNPVLTGSIVGLQNGDNITALYSTVADTNSPVGQYAITIGLLDPDHKLGNYVVTTNNGTLSVTAATLTVVANSASRAYGAANPAFSGTITGIENGDNITATYGTVADTNSAVGSYAIVPSLVDPGSKLTNYTVLSTNGTLSVTAATLTVVASNASRAYGAANPAFSGTITGIENGDNITATYGTVADTNSAVGSYAIVPSLVDPGSKLTNYTVLSTNGTLSVTAATLTVVASNASRAYGAANPAFSGTIAGIENGDNITATYGTVATTNSAVGGYAIVPSLVDPGSKLTNYTVLSTNGTLSVTAATLTVVASSASRAYGAANPAFSGTITGIENGDNITATYGTVADTNSAVGGYAIVPSLVDPGSKLTNYTVLSTNGTLSVTAATLTVVANSASRAYGAANPAFSGTITGIENGDNITATYGTVADTNSAVGGYAIVPSLVDPGSKLTNYTVLSTNGTLSVTAATLTVVASNASRAYGAANPAFSGTIAGIENGDNITATYGTVATTNSAVGQYAIVPSLVDPGSKLTNYTVLSTNGTLSVTAATLTVVASNASRAYGAANPAFSGTITGIENGDNITATYGTVATTNSAVGQLCDCAQPGGPGEQADQLHGVEHQRDVERDGGDPDGGGQQRVAGLRGGQPGL